jgi:DSF synthase
MLSGRIYTAEEMKDARLVHFVADPGRGIAGARDYIQRTKRRHNGTRAISQASREVNPVTIEEFYQIVQIWPDACLQLRERDLKVMQRLVSAQDRLRTTLRAAG